MSLLTIEEAAERLHKGPRWLRNWLRKHPADAAGRPFYVAVGRTILLSPNDVDRICEAMRPCPSRSSRRAKAIRRIGRSAGHTSKSMWTRAAELTNDQSLSAGSKTSRDGSSAASTR